MNQIFVYCWTQADGYCIKSYTLNGVYINTFSVLELHDWNNVLAVDKDNNVYCVSFPPTSNPDWQYIDTLRCYNKDGTLLYEFNGVKNDSLYAVCTDPDGGYVYTLEWRAVWDEVRIVKRASGIVDDVESKAIQYNNLCQGFIMDSNKNIYMKGPEYGYKSVKYNYDDSSPLQIKAYSNTIDVYQKTLAIVNGVLAIGSRGDYELKTAELDLSAYINESLDIATIQKPIGIGNIGNDFILCGYDTAQDNAILGRYKSDGTKIWETIIGTFSDTTPYQIVAYPFFTVITDLPTTFKDIQSTTLTAEGIILDPDDAGGYTFRGFEYYEKSSDPVYESSMYAVREIGIFVETLSFKMTLIGLKPLTTYYIRAFAGDANRLVYGEWVECTTTEVPSYGLYESEFSPTICFYLSEDDGRTWGLKHGPYTTDQADIEITKLLVLGSGKKKIKFTTDTLTGISASVMCKIDIKMR